jgi:hypothetical protein
MKKSILKFKWTADLEENAKVRRPEKTPGVGRPCGQTGSFFLDFLFLFYQEKRKERITDSGLHNRKLEVLYIRQQ